VTAVSRSLLTLFLLLVASCRATTSRPTYVPLPTAAVAQVELEVPQATRALAETMAKDSIALSRIREQDGFIDSGWLDAKTLEHTSARPLGRDVVRVRAWINPDKQYWSQLVVEGTWRPMDDPSRPERELDAPLPEDHPLQKRLGDVIRQMIEKYGDKEALKALAQPAAKPGTRADSARVKKDSLGVRKDTTAAKRDSLKVKKDTVKVKKDSVPITLHTPSPTPPADPGPASYPCTARSAG
jgi:hypothetical protein